jgi:hypothetical protein
LEVETTGSRSAQSAGRGSEAAHFVILFALRVVAEDVVGDRDLLELFLGARVGVGVKLLGQFAIRPGDLFVGRAGG